MTTLPCINNYVHVHNSVCIVENICQLLPIALYSYYRISNKVEVIEYLVRYNDFVS